MLVYLFIPCLSLLLCLFFKSSWPLAHLLSLVSTRIAMQEEGPTEQQEMCLLDLPELALDLILEKLPAESLFQMRGVCSSMRERCASDHLWENHMKRKWYRVIANAAYRERKWLAIANQNELLKPQHKGSTGQGLLMRILPWIQFSVDCDESIKSRKACFLSPRYENSVMAWYLALTTGRFCFPAQVYNRENGHVGFVLSCYDAELCYDPRSDTFQARYPPHGRRAAAVENCVPWERLRAPPVDTLPNDLHVSDCLNELRPGDQIEIQWRRNKEFPYGWWYGVVGHLEYCDGNETYCRCHHSDNVVLEFNQYARGSRWRCTTISRKNHEEEGNEADGFYGGIRKLQTKEEMSISMFSNAKSERRLGDVRGGAPAKRLAGGFTAEARQKRRLRREAAPPARSWGEAEKTFEKLVGKNGRRRGF